MHFRMNNGSNRLRQLVPRIDNMLGSEKNTPLDLCVQFPLQFEGWPHVCVGGMVYFLVTCHF